MDPGSVVCVKDLQPYMTKTVSYALEPTMVPETFTDTVIDTLPNVVLSTAATVASKAIGEQ